MVVVDIVVVSTMVMVVAVLAGYGGSPYGGVRIHNDLIDNNTICDGEIEQF